MSIDPLKYSHRLQAHMAAMVRITEAATPVTFSHATAAIAGQCKPRKPPASS